MYDTAQHTAGQLGSATTGKPRSHTDSTIDQLQLLGDTLADSEKRLMEIQCRLFGSPPQVEGRDGPIPVRAGRVAEIEQTLNALLGRAHQIQSIACELMNRI